ncbi:hypothetical protein ABT369_56020 [Dactylosporangium sp. NPDC000244]|uniref:hypothetical protein n=1 Tax=Dactylosporangium sp. NPDC000244 TaxID=3154365 RepID=UPI00332AA121
MSPWLDAADGSLPAGAGTFRFDPVHRLTAGPAVLLQQAAGGAERIAFDAVSGLWVIAGETLVAQACCDPLTFAEVPVPPLAGRSTPGPDRGLPQTSMPMAGLPLDHRVRAVLRLVWPASARSARRLWGSSIDSALAPIVAELAGPVDGHPLLGGSSMVEHAAGAIAGAVFGIDAAAAAAVAHDLQVAPESVTSAARAVLPIVLLRAAIAHAMRRHTTSGRIRAGTVLDDLQAYGRADADRLEAAEIAAVGAALFATVWDATAAFLPRLLDVIAARTATAGRPGITRLAHDQTARARLLDTAAAGMPTVAGWLRVTTQTVLLGGVRIPAGSTCLLAASTRGPASRDGSPVAVLRWLAPADPGGAGMAVARLAGDRLLAALGRHHTSRPASHPTPTQWRRTAPASR